MSASTPTSFSLEGNAHAKAVDALRNPGSLNFTGDLVFSDSPDYEKAIQRWVASSIRPAGVVAYPRTNEDVSSLIKWAAKENVEMVVCGGGHSASATSSTTGGLVIDLGRYLTSVEANAEQKTVLVGGGARWKAVEDVVNPLGLAAAAGTYNDTGVGGLALGGGLGHLMGTTGLVSDNILAATIVLASGEIVEANETSHPDLYWAIRGGGGAFGCVTSFTFRLHVQRPTVGFSMSIFGADQLETLIPKLLKWLEVRSAGESGILAFIIKDGNPLIMYGAVHNGPVEEGQQRINDIVETALMGKEMKEIPSPLINQQLNAFQSQGRTIYQTASFLPGLNAELIRSLFKEWMKANDGSRPGIDHMTVAFGLLNFAAASKVHPNATPFFNRGKDQVFLEAEITYSPGSIAEAKDLADHLRRVGGSQSSYLNLETAETAAASEDLKDVRALATFGEDNLRRLREIKKRYDPERKFRSWFG